MAKPAGTIKVRIEADDETRADMRQIARQEIASLCGLVLKRLGDQGFTMRWDKHGVETAVEHANANLKAIFGEALRDFSATTDQPGTKDAA